MMSKPRQHDDFNDVEIDAMHVLTSNFMHLWVTTMTGDHVTNYTHIIGAGHLHYYLSKCRNLHRHSQQGWEAMNQKLKHFYFNNTNHGGCGGNINGAMISGEHVKPLMRMCQRFIMWRLGHGDSFFMTNSLVVDDEAVEEHLEFGEL